MQAITIIALSITTTPLVMIDDEAKFTKGSLVVKVMADNSPIDGAEVQLFEGKKSRLVMATNRDGYAVPKSERQPKGIKEIELDSGSYQLTVNKSNFKSRTIKFFLPEAGYVEKIIAIQIGNQPPKANAGSDIFLHPKTQVLMDGRKSYDPDFPKDIDPEYLTDLDFKDEFGDSNGRRVEEYLWKVISKPDHSQINILDPHSPVIPLIPDVEGVYELELTVTDGIDQQKDAVRINAYYPISSKKQLPFPRGGHTSSIIGDSIYVIGGWNQVFLNRVDSYHTKNDSWKAVAPINVLRNHHVSFSYQGKIYIAGGHNKKQIRGISEVERYDPVNNTWQVVSKMPNPRYNAGGALYKGKFYIFGGSSGEKKVDVYDPFFNQWESLPDMPVGRIRHSVNVYNGKFYLFGGKGTEKLVSEFDVVTGQWTEKKPLPNPRYYHASATFEQRIFVVGGHSFIEEKGIDTVDEYDPENDQWRSLSSLPFAIDIQSMNSHDNGIYIFGGESQFGQTSVLNTSLVYNPLYANVLDNSTP
jgi:N-acetylneuraminic acid mutarotase